ECQGGTANDASGNANNGTITIGATGSQTAVGTCTTASTAWGNGVTGKYNSSLNFDGTDDLVLLNSSIAFGTNDLTVSGWVKIPSGKTSYGTMFSNYSGANNGIIFYSTDGRPGGIKATVEAPGVFSGYIATTSNTNDNNWHMLTIIRSGNNFRIYFDGKQENTTTGSASLGTGASNPKMGYATHTAGEAHQGQIDDVRIYNYALNDNQVKTLYNQGSAIQFAPATGSP
ncbi:LamG domain-containing protein, partial [Patescibacteria group bacterium]|nr:LamG domain-containing protein [Patescibacteria group bacterium]